MLSEAQADRETHRVNLPWQGKNESPSVRFQGLRFKMDLVPSAFASFQ